MSYDFLRGSSILVTGGTGSFGHICVERLLKETKAERIIIFSRDELKQSQMEAMIPDPDERLRFFLGDIRDLPRLERAFHGVDYVIHAAALKQVPMLEYNPYEAVKTNILGTQNVIEASIDQGVKKMILVSTDKAANPANLYGATKLCAERLTVSGNFYAGARGSILSVVRYGNVLGSRGSLLHIIRTQRPTGEITLTHEDMTRFWITLDQGVSLVFTALETMYGGEIFVPKIPSMKVKDVIMTLAPECKVRLIGFRPGEKLHEELVTPDEARHAREFDTYYVILPEGKWWPHYDKYGNGNTLPEGFSYASHTSTLRMSEDDVRSLFASL